MPKPWELDFVGVPDAEEESLKPWERAVTVEEAETERPPPPQPVTEPESEAGFGENFGKGFISGIYNIGTFMYGAGEAYHRPIAGGVSLSDLTPLQMGLKLFAPETAKSMRDGTADILAELADQSAKMSQKVLETGEYAKGLEGSYDVPLIGNVNIGDLKFDRGADPESWGVAFGSGAASLLPIIASGGVSAGLVIPTVGLQSFGTTYQRARTAYTEQGLSVEDAAQSAMIPALGQASVDMLMTKAGGALANKFGATNIEALNKAVRSPGFRDGVKGLSSKLGLKLKAATKGALIEGTIEEAPANFIGEYFIARHTFDPTVTLAQAGQEAWKSWVVGAGLGGGMGMVQKVETHDDVTAAARDAARRETIRSVAPTTASRLDERDAASLVLPDEEVSPETAPEEGDAKEGVLEPMVIPLRDKIVNEARKKGTLPLWWNRYEGDVGPEGTTVPSGLRYADQETVNRFIEDQEAHNELSQMSVEEDENGDWEVKRKGKAVDVFETEQEARQAAREAALAAAPVKVQNRIKRYKELTQKLVELDALDQSYQQQLERSQAQATEEEAAAVTPDISQEDQAFVAEKLGISIEDLKYSGLNITQEMVDQLRFAPEGSGIREFLNAAEKARQESPETPVTPLGDVRRIQDEAAKRAAEIKAERDQKELEAELISAKLQADAIAADTEMRTEREEEEGVPPALRRPTRPTEPKNSQQLGQLAERAVEDSAREGVTETDRTILNRLLERKATAVADSYGVKDEQQINSFVDLINQIDSQIAAVLGTPAPAPATQADLASMQESYADIEVEAPPVVPTAPEPEPVMTMKVGDTEVRVVNRTSGIDGVAHAARPSVTGAQMQPTLLKNINAALERISKRFGSILNLSEIQLTRIGGGAGVGSIARVGVTDSLLVDVDRLASSMSNKKFSLEKALEEELLHNLDGQALRAEYARLVRSGELSPTVDVRSFIESRYREIHNNMTADERAAARALYGNDFIDGVHMAQEFVRQLIQKRHTKSITEESYRGRPIKRLLKILGRMFNRMNLSSPLRAHVANVESFLERSYKTEIREATRAENKQRIKDERVARKQLLADEKKAKKERAVQEVRDQEDAYAATVEAVSYVANNRNFSWLNPQQGQSYGARIVDEVYDSWLKQYKAGKLTQPVPPKEWFKKAAMRRAGNLAQAEFGTEKRGSEFEFSSFEAAKEDYGLDPADNRPATESGERFISVVKEFNHLINLNPTQLTAFEARLRHYSNPETATMLGIAETSASTSWGQAIDKIAEASRNNANLRNVFIDAAQDPNFFIDASAVAYAADPIIRKERVAGLVEAQRKYQEGGKTRAEWDELNNAVEKFKAIARDYPQPAQESLLSREQIIAALKEDSAKKAADYFGKKDKGQTLDGEVIDVRIDIPAYLKTLKEKGKGDYVVTFHGVPPQNKPTVIGYDSFVHLTGFGDTGLIEFVEGKDKKKINIATDIEGPQGRKTSFARVRGAVASTTVIPDVTGPEWTQVGFDPERHSYFYNRANPTMRVTSGTEAVSVGNTVFVRNAEMEDAFDSGVAFAADPHMASNPDKTLASRILNGLGNVKKQLFRAFSSDGGLIMPSATNADKQLNFFQPKINKDAYINSVLGEVRGENRRLKKAVEKEFGKPTKQDVATMNNALNGNPDALEQLTPEIRDIILTMRTQIDALSGYIVKKGWVTGSLKATIDENIGTYLARSYRIFDEKGYVDNIDPEIQNQAITFVEQQLIKQGRSPIEAQEEAQARVAEMLQEYSKNDARDMFDRGKLGEKDLSLFMKRKDVAPEIRALLGEYTDPAVNYARSISRLAHFVGNHQFLTELKKVGMNEVFFDAKDFEGRNAAGADTAITGKVAGVKIKEGEEDVSRGSYSPLAGLYTTKEVADILNHYDRSSNLLDPSQPLTWTYGFLIKLNVFTKSMKTVASVMTHVRNLLGQPYFLLMNGHNPLAYRKARKAIAAIWADAAGSDKAAQAYFNKMTRLGLVGEEITTAELRRVMRNFQNEFDNSDSAQELLDRGTGKLLKATKQVWSAMVRTYRASDEIGKIMNFEMEKEALRPIRPDSTEAELEAEAAQRTRGGIPTYSMLPPSVQMLRMQPFVGPFMSFFYEAGRTQVMNVKYAMQEMRGDTAAHKAYAMRRISGHLAATVAMGYGIQMLSKLLFGISDEEEENFREFLPEWEKDAQFIMWRDKEGQLQYVNVSYNNPYSTTTDKMLAMAFISGKPEETVAKNIAYKTREMLDPFTSETIAAQALWNLGRNKDQYGNKIWNEQADFGDQFADAFEHGAKALTPATIERGWSKWRPAYLGKHLPKSARVPVLSDELLAEVTGFRIRTMDYEDAMLQGSFGAAADISEANHIFNRAAGRGGIVTDEEMLDAYEKANEARFRNFQQMAKKVRAAQLGGLKRHQIMSSMKIGKMSSADSASIINERFRPMFPSPQIIKKARDKGHAIPLQEINELRRKWMRKPLFENGE